MDKMDYLTSVSCVKGEDPYIEDFYTLHKSLGVEKFLFFDREQNHLSETFKGYSDVEVLYFPEPGRHHQAWAEGVKHLQGKTVWAQFIDIDQVVVPTFYDNIQKMLELYKLPYIAALVLNWHTFGSSGCNRKPAMSVDEWEEVELSSYDTFWHRARGDRWINNHVQTIARLDKDCLELRPWDTPHNAPIKPGFQSVNTRGEYVGGYTSSPPDHSVGFVAHYYTRSREEWNKKITKGRADTGTILGLDPHWEAAYRAENIEVAGDLFDIHNSYLNEVEDTTVQKIWRNIILEK